MLLLTGSCTYILYRSQHPVLQFASQWLVQLTGGPIGTCDHAETARTLLLMVSCFAAACRSAVLDEASIAGVYSSRNEGSQWKG
jgi:hypothetical protein